MVPSTSGIWSDARPASSQSLTRASESPAEALLPNQFLTRIVLGIDSEIPEIEVWENALADHPMSPSGRPSVDAQLHSRHPRSFPIRIWTHRSHIIYHYFNKIHISLELHSLSLVIQLSQVKLLKLFPIISGLSFFKNFPWGHSQFCPSPGVNFRTLWRSSRMCLVSRSERIPSLNLTKCIIKARWCFFWKFQNNIQFLLKKKDSN